ncbi:transglutaminase [Rheinheimera sp. SA_1]|uniref:transglutaminase family protein n=1 Tax=Rheinheimera sp. SA_1 TaxID=1827365 RepID=UPI0007FF67D5|nr:transglutaminase family protein [Rheinheimera sp. SA_1]OBP13861.1 transglutaminase [Rheinheimera sp. SA_1]
MKYQLSHLTRYQYQQPIANSYNLACLQPRQLPYQQVLQSSIQVTPVASGLYSHLDSFGNVRHFIHLQSPHQELSVLASSIVEVQPRYLAGQLAKGVDFDQLQHCFINQSPHNQILASKDLLLARQCRFASRMIPLLPGAAALWAQVQQPHRTVLENVSALTSLIFNEFSYDPEFSSVITPVSEVLEHRRGVCQDFAQLAISCLRAVGIPARYVSGYLETQPPEGFERLVGADASHAWFAVYDPELGWVDFDPTNNLLPDERHLTLAYGRDYADVVPLKGVLQGLGEHLLEVAVDVMPLP